MRNILLSGYPGLLASKVISDFTDGSLFSITRNLPTTVSSTPQTQFINLDLSTDFGFDSFPKSCDTVIHLAQSSEFRNFPDKAADIFGVNIHATLKLLEYARIAGAKRFIYASSGAVYAPSDSILHEDRSTLIQHTQSNPNFYSFSKLGAEQLCMQYSSFFKIIILRFFFIYGPGQKADMLIPRLIHRIFEGSPIDIQGTEGLTINPVFVNDASQAVLKASHCDQHMVCNVAGPSSLTIKEIAESIGNLFDKKPLFQFSKNPAQKMIASIEKMSSQLYEPKYSFDNSLPLLLSSLNNDSSSPMYKSLKL
jgi:UDP-glucose 4-epimerase